MKVTVMERAPELRKAGQQIDIRGPGVQVIKRMGTEEAIRAATTKEKGLAFVTSNGKTVAKFPVDEKSGMSFSCDIEILRERLVKVFYDATKKETDTEYIFGDHVTALEQDKEKVTVTLASGAVRSFDLVIGADGMGSKIRRLVFLDQNALKSLGQYTSFFTIPFLASDGELAKWYNAPGGRSIVLRPDNAGCTRSYLSIISPKPAGYASMSIPEQKTMYRELFKDAGWEILRVLDGMDTSDDFYMQEIAQIKMPRWSFGRVALLGDAGYCPSPISGMGTTLAIVGAYILAGEIAANRTDLEKAFKGYEERMRPMIDKAQYLPPGAPGLASPQSVWGVKVFNAVVGFVGWSGLGTLFQKIAISGSGGEDVLHEYIFDSKA